MGKKFKVRLTIGSIVFGLGAFGQELYSDGVWNIKGLGWILYGIIAFYILSYIFFYLWVGKMKKRKDKDKLSDEKECSCKSN